MPRVPFIGRLFLHEYLALITSFLLLGLELFVRTVTLLLPDPIFRFFYRISRSAFNTLSSPHSRRSRNTKKSVSTAIAQASDFIELCELYGYYAEEHVVQTGDGYLLGVHRLGWKKGEEEQRVNAGPGSLQKKVVYLHHGLLMNSEVWVCITEKERILPFVLVDQGYDVWLGNNRGGKYSRKCLHHSPTEIPFWDFSIDQFAFYDIPDSINYVLSTTQQPSLSYVGFSQGSAQAFAALSIHPTLNEKVDVFVALAPAMAPPGLASGVVSSLVKSSPEVLFLAFGRRAIMGSAPMWQSLLYPDIFTYAIDKCLDFLFGWKTRNITAHQKLAAYPHLYSFTSTKSVVHWFQIIRNGTFQMYDDEVMNPLAISHGSKYYKVAQFPTRNIKTPVVLVYGGSDSLVDIKLMLKKLPKHTVAKCIPKYEHLDLLWAGDVDKLAFPHVIDALESYASNKTKTEKYGWTGVERGIRDRASLYSPNGSQPPGYSEDEQSARQEVEARRQADAYNWGVEETSLVEGYGEDDPVQETSASGSYGTGTPASGSSPATASADNPGGVRLHKRVRSSLSEASSSQGTVKAESKRRIALPRLREQQREPLDDDVAEHLGSPLTAVALTERSFDSRPSRPEGWWSSTDSTADSSPVRSRHDALSVDGDASETVMEGKDEDTTGRNKRSRVD